MKAKAHTYCPAALHSIGKKACCLKAWPDRLFHLKQIIAREACSHLPQPLLALLTSIRSAVGQRYRVSNGGLSICLACQVIISFSLHGCQTHSLMTCIQSARKMTSGSQEQRKQYMDIVIPAVLNSLVDQVRLSILNARPKVFSLLPSKQQIDSFSFTDCHTLLSCRMPGSDTMHWKPSSTLPRSPERALCHSLQTLLRHSSGFLLTWTLQSTKPPPT